MAMNRQRRTSNLNNIVRYDTSGNVNLPAGLTVEGLDAGFVKSDANGLFSIDTTIYQPQLPSQTGNAGKFLTTNGSVVSWGTVSTINIYEYDGTLTGNRLVTMGTFTLSFEKDILINGITVGRGPGNIATNTVIGFEAAKNLTTSPNHVIIGYQAGYNLTTQISSSGDTVAIGYQAGYNQTQSYNNVYIGYKAGFSNQTGTSNTFIGNGSGANTTGRFNTFVGDLSGRTVTTGEGNTFVGQHNASVLNYLITTGSNNTIIGRVNAISNVSNNVILADGQGNIRIRAFDTGNVTINSNTDAGFQLDVNGTARVSGNTYLNNILYVGSGGGVNGLRITTDNISKHYYDATSVGIRFINDNRFILYGGAAPGFPVDSYNIVKVQNGNGTAHIFGTHTDGTEQLSALVEIKSTTQGFLPPRMTSTQRTAISTPATGLLAYNTDATEGLYLKLSGEWKRLATSDEATSTTRITESFTATASQTVFITTNTLIAGYFDVYLNGVRLNASSYSTAVNSITLVTAARAGDIVDIVIYQTLSFAPVVTSSMALFNYYNFI